MSQRSTLQLCTSAVAIAAFLSFGLTAHAQDECAANKGVLISATGAPDVCYPIFFWPYWWWGCSWHSCAPGLTCIPTTSPPYFTCVPTKFVASPCCPKNQLYCYNQVPGPRYCKSQTWVDMDDCTSPQLDVCTRRQRAIPQCVPATCANILCPKCHRCVTTKAGPRCVRTCEWGCTWCPKGTFCVENYLYGAMCIPWPWWQWQALSSSARVVDPRTVTVTCNLFKCPVGTRCIMTVNGPQCSKDCAYDNCSITDVAPDPPTALQGVQYPTCNPGCSITFTPKFERPVNSCVDIPACVPPQVCVEGATSAEPASCQTL